MLTRLIQAAQEAERVGAWDEALARYEEALSRLPGEGDAALAADLLRWIGTVRHELGDHELSAEAYDASLAIAQANGLAWHAASVLNCLAVSEHYRGRLDEAEPLYARARELAEMVGDDRLMAAIDHNLGAVANIRGHVATALVRYRSALRYYRRSEDVEATVSALNNMGMAHVDQAEWREAEECFREARALAETTGNTRLLGSVELNRAELYLRRQRFEDARESCERALEIFTALRSKPRIGEAYKYFGILYRETGRLDQADVHFALALGLAEASQNRLLEAEANSEWALAHIEAGRSRDALRALNRAHTIFGAMRARLDMLEVERLLRELQGTYVDVVGAWGAQMAESMDGFLAGHSRRVADYGTRLAEEVGIRGWDLTWLRVGALVHDVGKSAVPADVIRTARDLDPEERAILRNHTVVGEAMVGELEFPAPIRPLVRSHHERWDGRGYPDGLAGESIPLPARILAVANSFDALATERRNRPALSHREAVDVLIREAGSVLDPELVWTFQKVIA